MKILINCVNLLSGSQGAGGAGSYVTSLIKELSYMSTIRLLIHPKNFIHFQGISNIQLVPIIDNTIDFIYSHLSWSDVYFCPLNELVPKYLDSQVPVVCSILDLQHEVYPHFFKSSGIYEARFASYSSAISRADGILTISNHEKSLIESLYNIKDVKKVYVTYLSGYLAEGSLELFENIDQLYEDLEANQYLLYPAIPWRHKNHRRLLEAFYIFKNLCPQGLSDIKLVLTGSTHSLSGDSLTNIIDDLKINNSVRQLGFISDIQLRSLMKNAKALVFPSLYEGFGIPIVDSMMLGTPVIASHCTAIPEVAGDAIEYFKNPWDSNAIARDLLKFLTSESRLAFLSSRSKIKASEYSSEKTANLTLNAFKDTIKRCRHSRSKYINTDLLPPCFYQNSHLAPLSIVLNCLKLTDINILLSLCQNLAKSSVRVIPILNHEFHLSQYPDLSSMFEVISRPVYSFTDSSSPRYSNYLVRLLGFVFDCVVDSKYVMYSSFDSFYKSYKNIDFSLACKSLDHYPELSAIQFTNKVSQPFLKTPFSGEELSREYEEIIKNNVIDFFDLMILRSKLKNLSCFPGQYKHLSMFLSGSTYLSIPLLNTAKLMDEYNLD